MSSTIRVDQDNVSSALSIKDSLDIIVRQMNFEFPDSTPKYWFNGNPHLTLLLTAFMATFPEGEMEFVRSVRNYQDKIDDPELKARVSAFIGQEAHHGKEHRTLNEFMDRKGVSASKISDQVKDMTTRFSNNFSKAQRLANTCAAEHLTAIFAEQVLDNTHLINGVEDVMKPILLWHSVEESEHKAVAFDVYQKFIGSDKLRRRTLAVMTLFMSVETTLRTINLLREDGQLTNYKSAIDAAQYLWGKNGFLKGLGGRYRSFYRKGFHPNDSNTKALEAKGIELLRQYVGDKAGTKGLAQVV